MRMALNAASPETSFTDVVEILHRRKQIAVGVLLATTVVGGCLALRPRTYAASGTIRIQSGDASEYRTSTVPTNRMPEDRIASDVAILKSHSLNMRVARELDLANEPSIWRDAKSTHRSLDDPKTRQKLDNWLKDAIRVYHTPKDEIIGIACTTKVPALSSRIVNALINDYVAYLFEMRSTSTKRTSGWLVGQLDDLKALIAQDQVELVALQGKLGVIGFDPHTNDFLATQSLDSFTKAASAATIDRIVAESKYRFLAESDPGLIEGEVNVLPQAGVTGEPNSLLRSLRTSRAEASSSYAKLSARFGSKYPDVKQAKAQLDELDREVGAEESRIRNQAELAFKAAVANESKTNAEVRARKHEVFQSQGEMTRYLTLLTDYSSHKTLYEGLIQRLREAAITSGLEAGEVDIVDLADIPALPVPPGPLAFLITSMLAGVVLGCLAALVVEAVDARVFTVEQVERIVSLPVLAETPRDAWFRELGKDVSVRVLNAPRSAYAEALQVLRSTLCSTRAGQLPRILLVTSALPKEGKTVTAANLAAVAALHGLRVLLVDCNFHHQGAAGLPAHTAESISSVGGLTEVLAGYVPLEEALRRPSGLCNLEVLAAGSQPPSSAVLLGSDAMRQLLTRCRDSFDFIVLDSSPVLGFADAFILGALVDSALLVVKSESSAKSATRRAAKLLAGSDVPIAGILLNESRSVRSERPEREHSLFGDGAQRRLVKRIASWVLLILGAIGTSRAQYAGPSGSGFEVPRAPINRSFLNNLINAKRPELLFQVDDVLAVEAYGIPNFKFQQRVAEDGTITAPLIGKIKVAGLTVEETEASLARLLSEGQMINDASLNVYAVSRPSAMVTVSGAVARPGIFPVTGDLTLSKALSLAGGLNGTSGVSTGPPASSVVTLIRPTLGEPVNVPLGPDTTSSPYGLIPLFPGDEIRVGRLGTIYTIGAFHTQGPLALKDTNATTVLNAVSMAGGVGFQAKEKQAYIIRANHGQKVVIPVKLQDILKGKSEDIAMQDQDILMLPTSQMKAAIKGGGAALIVSVASAFIYSGTI